MNPKSQKRQLPVPSVEMCISCPAKIGSFEEYLRTNMIKEYIQPLSKSFVQSLDQGNSLKTLFHATHFFDGELPDLTQFDLAILGVNEDRFRPEYIGTGEAPNAVRKELYYLVKTRKPLRVLDLGNIVGGNSFSDTYFALSQVILELNKAKLFSVIIGGSQNLISAQYSGFQGLNPNMQVLVVDAKVDLQVAENPNEQNYLPKIISHEPEYLFNITQAGYQGHFVEPETYDAFEKMNFDLLRLGSLRGNIQTIEPYCRNANMFAMSLQAIRASDAPAQLKPSPNGFSSEEACQIARYAGLGNDLLSAGFFDLNPSQDRNNISASLVAQLIWYLLDGISNRKNEYPVAESKDYIIYHTTTRQMNQELTFYKSVLSNRWWMEVPYPNERSKHDGKFLVPCSYQDYQTAQNDEIPDRWMKTYQKLI